MKLNKTLKGLNDIFILRINIQICNYANKICLVQFYQSLIPLLFKFCSYLKRSSYNGRETRKKLI